MYVIPRLAGGCRIERCILLAIALVPLVACSRAVDPEPLPPHHEPSTAASLQAEKVDSTLQNSAVSAETPTLTIQPVGSTATKSEMEKGLIPCGTILPLLLENIVRPTSALNATDFDLDSVPTAARPALQRMLDAPESVGLVAFEIGGEREGIYFNADTPMPLASLVKIINLIAYAEAAEIGALDPAEWIPISEIERAYLPGSDLGAHRASISELEEKGLISTDLRSIPMEQVPWMMMRHSSNASSDFLQMSIGQEIIESTAHRLNLPTHTAPCPFVGQFLSISNHTRSGNVRQAVGGFVDDPEIYGQEVMRLTDIFMEDPEFRRAEGYWRAPVSVQRYFTDNLSAKASARDYAQLMSMIIQNNVGSDYVNILVRRAIEWPMIYAANQQLFSAVGYKNGSLPGVLTIAYYGQRLEDGAQVVVVILFRDLPAQMYRQWRQNLTHDELARWLLADPDAIRMFRTWMDDPS